MGGTLGSWKIYRSAYPNTTHGTARTDCRETARGGARGVWLGRQSVLAVPLVVSGIALGQRPHFTGRSHQVKPGSNWTSWDWKHVLVGLPKSTKTSPRLGGGSYIQNSCTVPNPEVCQDPITTSPIPGPLGTPQVVRVPVRFQDLSADIDWNHAGPGSDLDPHPGSAAFAPAWRCPASLRHEWGRSSDREGGQRRPLNPKQLLLT